MIIFISLKVHCTIVLHVSLNRNYLKGTKFLYFLIMGSLESNRLNQSNAEKLSLIYGLKAVVFYGGMILFIRNICSLYLSHFIFLLLLTLIIIYNKIVGI